MISTILDMEFHVTVDRSPFAVRALIGAAIIVMLVAIIVFLIRRRK
jgi:uncharacterized membrane protein